MMNDKNKMIVNIQFYKCIFLIFGTLSMFVLGSIVYLSEFSLCHDCGACIFFSFVFGSCCGMLIAVKCLENMWYYLNDSSKECL